MLVVGTSHAITPVDKPTADLVARLQNALKQLNLASTLGSASAITDLGSRVQKQIDDVLQQSGEVATTTARTTTATATTSGATSTTTTPGTTTTAP